PVLGEVEAVIDRPHHPDQFFVDDVDELLARLEAAQYPLADSLLGDALGELVDDVVIDVGVEKGLADFAQALLDVGLGDATAAAELVEGLGQAARNALEHDSRPALATREASLPLLGPDPRRRRRRARPSR